MRCTLIATLALAAAGAVLIADGASAQRGFVAGGFRGVGFRGGFVGVRPGFRAGWGGWGYRRWYGGYGLAGAAIAGAAVVGAGAGYPYGYDLSYYGNGGYGYGYAACSRTLTWVLTPYGYQRAIVSNCY